MASPPLDITAEGTRPAAGLHDGGQRGQRADVRGDLGQPPAGPPRPSPAPGPKGRRARCSRRSDERQVRGRPWQTGFSTSWPPRWSTWSPKVGSGTCSARGGPGTDGPGADAVRWEGMSNDQLAVAVRQLNSGPGAAGIQQAADALATIAGDLQQIDDDAAQPVAGDRRELAEPGVRTGPGDDHRVGRLLGSASAASGAERGRDRPRRARRSRGRANAVPNPSELTGRRRRPADSFLAAAGSPLTGHEQRPRAGRWPGPTRPASRPIDAMNNYTASSPVRPVRPPAAASAAGDQPRRRTRSAAEHRPGHHGGRLRAAPRRAVPSAVSGGGGAPGMPVSRPAVGRPARRSGGRPAPGDRPAGSSRLPGVGVPALGRRGPGFARRGPAAAARRYARYRRRWRHGGGAAGLPRRAGSARRAGRRWRCRRVGAVPAVPAVRRWRCRRDSGAGARSGQRGRLARRATGRRSRFGRGGRRCREQFDRRGRRRGQRDRRRHGRRGCRRCRGPQRTNWCAAGTWCPASRTRARTPGRRLPGHWPNWRARRPTEAGGSAPDRAQRPNSRRRCWNRRSAPATRTTTHSNRYGVQRRRHVRRRPDGGATASWTAASRATSVPDGSR